MITFEQFLNSEIKARLVKFFVLNPSNAFSSKEIARRLNLKTSEVTKALKDLVESGIVKLRSIKSEKFYQAETRSVFWNDLKNLVLKFPVVSHDKLLNDIKKIGVVKLAILSGVFLNTEKYRVDLFLVVDRLKENQFKRLLEKIEQSIGKEISYSLMNTKEFRYRQDMFDRFIRDILEYPHEKLINKLKV